MNKAKLVKTLGPPNGDNFELHEKKIKFAVPGNNSVEHKNGVARFFWEIMADVKNYYIFLTELTFQIIFDFVLFFLFNFLFLFSSKFSVFG